MELFEGGGDFRVYQRDAVSLMLPLDAESIDLIVTDPAYESLEKHRAVGTTTRHKNDWFPVVPNSYFPAFFREAYRVLKKNTHLYLFCDQETMFAIKPMGEAAGFTFWKPIVWDKIKIGMGYHYRSRYELILFFEKGKRKLNNLGIPDVLEFPRVRGRFPTEKPVGVSEVLISQSSKVGDVVLDPFCGSGSVGQAALVSQRRFIGGDLEQRAVAMTIERLEGLSDEH